MILATSSASLGDPPGSRVLAWLRWLTSPCLLIGHDEAFKVLTASGLHLECPRCGADLGVVLKGQRFVARSPARTLRLVRLRRAG